MKGALHEYSARLRGIHQTKSHQMLDDDIFPVLHSRLLLGAIFIRGNAPLKMGFRQACLYWKLLVAEEESQWISADLEGGWGD
jgi:hypothetical protein